MILQKGNSGRQWRWGCSAFGVLAPVAIERPARVKSALRPCSVQASAKSAILHSCIMAQESRECSHNAQLCKHSLGKMLLPVPVLQLFFTIKKAFIKHQKSVAGNIGAKALCGCKGAGQVQGLVAFGQ